MNYFDSLESSSVNDGTFMYEKKEFKENECVKVQHKQESKYINVCRQVKNKKTRVTLKWRRERMMSGEAWFETGSENDNANTRSKKEIKVNEKYVKQSLEAIMKIYLH